MREFLKEKGFYPEENATTQQNKPSEKTPESSTLLSVYKEQFRYIQQLESVDFKFFVFTITVFSALWVLASLPSIEANIHHLYGIVIILVILSAAASHITIKNATIRWSRFLTLGQIEKALGLTNNNIIPESTRFVLPVSFRDFVVRFLFSPSGPKVLVYTTMMMIALIEIQWDILQVRSVSFFFLLLLVPLTLAFLSIYANYTDIIHQFKAMNGEVDLGAVTGMKSPADQYCDIADALLQMRPPLPSEALRHFREALRLETDNVRAKVGFDRLMNFKCKNVNNVN